MNFKEWKMYRRIEMYQIEKEIDNQIDKELDEMDNPKKKPISIPLHYGILLYSSIVIFLCFYVYFSIFHFEIMCEFLELPILKPIVLTLPAGIAGLHARHVEKKKKEIIKKD